MLAAIMDNRADIVTGSPGRRYQLVQLKSPFSFSAFKTPFRVESTVPSESGALKASGSFEFGLKDQPVQIGDTGVRVSISDLSIAAAGTDAVAGGVKYVIPSFTRMGFAEITGSSGNDVISVGQDSSGNTYVEVQNQGKQTRLTLGRIAGVSISGGEGDDAISVDAGNYYGGITVGGDAGDDSISVKANMTLKRGVSIYGGEGDDTIAISGKAMQLYVSGGEGNDNIDAGKVSAESELSRSFFGDAGTDVIQGSSGADMISGGEGPDIISAGGGDDVIKGDEGNDIIHGGAGDDNIKGGAGDDVIYGEAGRDLMHGEGGNDVLAGGASGDFISGGDGEDRLYGGGSADEVPL